MRSCASIQPARRTLVCLALAVALKVQLMPCAAAMTIPEEVVWDAAQDSTGRVWAIVRKEIPGAPAPCPDGTFAETRDFTPVVLATWENDGWRPVDVSLIAPGQNEGALRRLFALPDGSVACEWELIGDASGANTFQLTRHCGAASEKWADLGALPAWTAWDHEVTADSKGRAWVATRRIVSRVNDNGVLETAHEFGDADYAPAGSAVPNREASFAHLRLVPDDVGRVWVWAEGGHFTQPFREFRGLWVFGQDAAGAHPVISGLPDKPLLFFAHKTGSTFWVSVFADGLYEFNADTSSASRVDEPEPGAFRFVQQVVRADGDGKSTDTWYATASSVGPTSQLKKGGVTLWRSLGGRWEKVLPGLQRWFGMAGPDAVDRQAVVDTSVGLWVATDTDGVWCVPPGGAAPVNVDWRRGLPGVGAVRMFLLSDGNMLVFPHKREYAQAFSCCVAPDEWLKPPKTCPNVEAVDLACRPGQDDRKHIWAVRAASPRMLGEWDGTSWKEYPLPKTVISLNLLCAAVDVKRRVWLWQCSRFAEVRRSIAECPVAIWDTAKEKWTTYPTALDALKAHRREASFRFLTHNVPQPQIGRDRRVAFCADSHGPVFYLDGSEWRKFARSRFGFGDIAAVFFDDEGCLCVNASRRDDQKGGTLTQFTYVLGREGNWERRERIANTPVSLYPVPSDLMKHPDWAGTMPVQPSAVYVDHLGMLWYWGIENHGLYRKRLDVKAPQYTPEELNPFTAAYTIVEAFEDAAGNTLLLAGFNAGYLIKPREPAIETLAAIGEIRDDGAAIALSSPGTSNAWFAWRLDGGPWSTFQHEGDVILRDLLGGEHRFEAIALDERLQPDPTPAEVTFDLRLATADIIQRWIAQLADPDFDKRKEAVAALARHPDVALPALRAARPAASPEVQWWIDAAIEQAQRTAREKTP